MTKCRCISSSKPFSDVFLGQYGQVDIQVYGESGQSDFTVIAIKAEQLWIQPKTTNRKTTFTFGKSKERSSGTLNEMIFQLIIEVRIYLQSERMRPTDPLR